MEMPINFDVTRIKTEPVDDFPPSNIFDVGQGPFMPARVKEEFITNDEPNLPYNLNDQQPVPTLPTLDNLSKNPKIPVLENTKYPCNLCPNWFRSFKNMQRHKSLIHNEESAHLCDQCGQCFKLRQDLHVHETFTHNKLTSGEFRCNHCQMIFLSEIDFTNHNNKIHPELEPGLFCSSVDIVASSSIDGQLLRCKQCPLKFRTQVNLSNHMLNFHNVEMASIINPTSLNNEMDEYSCALCNKVCENQESLETHQAGHLRVLPFVCDKCDFAAEFKSQLLEHEMNHFSDSEKPLNCGYCSITFVEMGVMKQHMKIFHRDKQSERKKRKKAYRNCDQCDAKFKSKSALKYHKSNVHFSKVYHCYLCEFQFKTKLHLTYHKMRVHGDRTGLNQRLYECSKCSIFFGSRTTIASHNKNHHGKLILKHTSNNFNSDLILIDCSDEDKVPQRGRPRTNPRGRPRKHPNLITSQTGIAYKHSKEQVDSQHNNRFQYPRKQSLVTTQESLRMLAKYNITPCIVQLERISNENIQNLVASTFTETRIFQNIKPCFVRLETLPKEIISSFRNKS